MNKTKTAYNNVYEIIALIRSLRFIYEPLYASKKITMNRIEHIENEISELRNQLQNHKLYENLMDFWANTLSKRIYNLDYEQLTVNQESETRQLIDYLDLDWDEKCLSPQNNKRNVATASNVQIRKKVYRGSSEQWKKYQPFLNGAFDSLLSS